MELEEFAAELADETSADEGDSVDLLEEKFTLSLLGYLEEVGEFEDAAICYHRERGKKVNGYQLRPELESLDLLIAVRKGEPMQAVTPSDIEKNLGWLGNFLEGALEGGHTRMDQESAGFDLAFQIFSEKESLTKIRLFLITDGVVRKKELKPMQIGELEASVHLWDIQRFYRQATSGTERESIVVDFAELGFGNIQGIEKRVPTRHYTTFLAVFPGELLYSLYDRWGPRLLERNVRAFLQARGSVNKGIKKTVQEDPEMFFAYNNGITATADSVVVKALGNGWVEIQSAEGFQIVNGGQTTASIYHTVKKDGCDISGINVQVKLTVPTTRERLEEMVPLISRYANTQNKVNIPDLLSNHPFHRKLEELSRTVWAPPATGSNEQTQWFYERARGQYMDEKSRCTTPAQKRKFNKEHPSKQKLTKTDVAKFENTWAQRPHVVSLGAQKNFVHFTEELAARGQAFQPDQRYFEDLIAKALLFKVSEKLVQRQSFGGYRANIVTYTLSWLFHLVAQKIDLNKVWQRQGLSGELEAAIIEFSKCVRNYILKSAGSKNVSEWCKKPACWEGLLALEPPTDLKLCLEIGEYSAPTGNRVSRAKAKKGDIGITEEETVLISGISDHGQGYWWELASWAKSTNQLESWQRGIAASVAKAIGFGRKPSIKQAKQADKIWREAERLGFSYSEEEGGEK